MVAYSKLDLAYVGETTSQTLNAIDLLDVVFMTFFLIWSLVEDEGGDRGASIAVSMVARVSAKGGRLMTGKS